MKFALLVASASAAATIETYFACTKADDCKTTTDACCDAKIPTTAVTGDDVKINAAAKVCLPKSTTWSQKWTTAPTGALLTQLQKWVVASGATPDVAKTYKADLTCMAAGAKALSAAAVLAASYYMA